MVVISLAHCGPVARLGCILQVCSSPDGVDTPAVYFLRSCLNEFLYGDSSCLLLLGC